MIDMILVILPEPKLYSAIENLFMNFLGVGVYEK